MYGYICAILLLICGKVYSDSDADAATEIRGDSCIYGTKYFSTGAHTIRPCLLMICNSKGQMKFYSCPTIKCHPGVEVIGYQPETEGKSYPHCCGQPICELKPEEPYALPLMSWE